MCGIFGYISFNNNCLADSIVKNMGNVIKYRGPDGQGIYSSANVALGNQRLAIIDIENGNQPFYSDDKTIVVVQNGEIFNHIELAKELIDTPFECRTHSDTEVILRLYEKYGSTFISKLNGMFAIAIWDSKIQQLMLIRDRVGEKPLHYYKKENYIIFGSEIKSILSAGIERNLNKKALDTLLTYNYVVPPLTMFENVYHVMPGTYLKITHNKCEAVTWWDLSKIKVQKKDEKTMINEFNSLLEDAVNIRLRSDVPFGAFLSGGVDSSTVVGLMSKRLEHPVKTFSIGFHDPLYDESIFAQQAADRFNTDHIMEKVEANLLNLWPKATYHCDQPHGDVSFMPTYRVAELASHSVKMVLTGDGADELFAGYDKYKSFFQKNNNPLTDEEFRIKYTDNISIFKKEQKNDLYNKYFHKSIEDFDASKFIKPLFDKSQNMDRINQALYIDTMLLLPGNNLVKPDRMGMAVSIENRAPFLDYRVIEFAFSIPGDFKLRNNETKYIYKKSVADLIGNDLAYRKKQMFTVPVGEWFKNELKDLVNELLFSERAKKRNIFNTDYIKRIYKDHCNGKKNNTRELRILMALEIWFRKFMDR
ncbi:asparagine synthase (glutamine-hydrolyzing) [Xenorhabdus bovienii]|uniref:asparagine synthase (glutamine-hydrolyzing) n=2 Tax=Xenorhabdus bovienii TaxID=40576 RepID=UPI0023B233AF|nr:asparagine synthase (glutamine-hydrolyzing) [Xenorhabdus bovienii]MDE9493189.1 asparagine synthase (glutamine-hydrolyzing) [Xenorhabdus bovienii]MDE9501725.1 asparagine synthase (glutamine-hydrolyzing) [Xenorhabdus bovienii]MDE9525509.1 asparagine synthase (glutamine-hydrolyzing) [Xenorhabdus bovienii]MDE9568054.1 asparagine synthase (glutamine-hydrolyzing) [Xenorhabdus bovienii]